MSASGGSVARPHHAIDAGLLILAIGLAALTLVVAAIPAVAPAVVNERLELAIVTGWALTAGAVAALDWARGRVARDGAALLRASAFTVLAMLNALALIALVFGVDALYGGSLEEPGQLPIISGVVARGMTAVLLAAAGVAALRQPAYPRLPGVILLGPTALVFAVLTAAAALQDRLPPLVTDAALRDLAMSPAAGLAPGSAPVLVIIQALIAATFLVAALLAHRAYMGNGRMGTALLTAGLVVAAFSQIHGAIHPGGYTGVVTTGDLLRLAFYALLLAAIVVDRRDDLADLRAANAEIRRLADAEMAGAALAERARLAREIHDGLAQDLWYAKLKQTRLAQLAGFSGEASELSDEVGDAIDAALAEARNAVAAMREGAEAGPLLEMLERHVNDFADRFALRAEFRAEGVPPAIGPRAKAEVLRILQEALTNIRKHADATTVRVSVQSDGALRMTVADNGRGFRPDQAASGFGLDSMRQRAVVIGGTLTVSSEPRNGTRVELVLPNAKEGGETDADRG